MDLMELSVALRAANEQQVHAALKRVEVAGKQTAATLDKSMAASAQAASASVARATAEVDRVTARTATTAARTAAASTARAAASATSALSRVRPALESVGRELAVTGALGVGGFKSIAMAATRLAGILGPAGAVVSAIGLATAGIVSMHRKARDEMEATKKQHMAALDEMQNAGDVAGLAAKARLVQEGTAAKNFQDGLIEMQKRAAELRRAMETGQAGTSLAAIRRATREVNELEVRIAAAKESLDDIARRRGAIGEGRAPSTLAAVTTIGRSEAAVAKDVAAAQRAAAAAFRERIEAEISLATIRNPDAIAFLTLRESALTQAIQAGIGSRIKLAEVEGELARIRKALAREEVAAVRIPGEDAALRQIGFPTADKITDDVLKTIAEVRQNIAKAQPQLLDIGAQQNFEALRENLAKGVAFALTAGIAAGFEAAFADGSIGAGFAALGNTLVSGLGAAMVQFGQASLMTATLMESIKASLEAFLPGGAVVASLAMIAIGGAMMGMAGHAQRSFGNMGRYGGGGGGYGGGLGGYGSRAPLAAGEGLIGAPLTPASAPPPVNVNFTVIGTDSPQVERDIARIIKGAIQRGLIPRTA